MKLRSKTMLIVTVTLAGLLVILAAVSRVIILRDFARIEERETAQAVRRGVSVISETLAALDATCRDRAHRDDISAFASTGNSESIGKNLTADAFRALGINLFLIADTQGRIVFARMVDYLNGRELPPPPDLGEFLALPSPLRTMQGAGESRVGVILLSMGQLLFAAHSITTSERRGSVRGFLIMGRFLDDREMNRMAIVANETWRLFRLDQTDLPDDVRSASVPLLKDDRTVIRPLNEHEEAGYTLIRDLRGRPGLILRVDLPRVIHRKGIESFRSFLFLLLASGLMLGLVMVVLLDRAVTSRPAGLHDGATHAVESGDPTPQVGLPGRVEISNISPAEEAIQQSETRFRRLFIQSKDVIIITSGENLVDLNPAGLQLLGLSKEAVRHGIPLDNYFDPVDCRKIKERITSYGFVQEYETCLQVGNGEKRTVLISATGSMEEGENQMVCQGIVRDITEHRLLERQRAQIERMESIGNLAGGMAHDFNNILTAIMTHISKVKNSLPAGDPLLANCEAMEKATNMGSELIASLMAFTHDEPSRKKAVHLNKLVRDTISIIRRTFTRSITIETRLAESLPIVEADGGKIKQAIMNLCINARDAMPDGGTLTVETALADISPPEAERDPQVRAGRFIVLSVSDTGTGMSRETMQRIFEPFFTTKPAGQGTGLGLSVVYGVAKGHGGFIAVRSSPGEGSRFLLHLPAENRTHPA